MPIKISNLGYNRNVNVYHKRSGKCKIRANEFNHQYLDALNWSQTIETIRSSDMSSMDRIIENHTNIDSDMVEWMHTLAFAAKANPDYNPTWDESKNGPHKERYKLSHKKDIHTLNKKHA